MHIQIYPDSLLMLKFLLLTANHVLSTSTGVQQEVHEEVVFQMS